MDVREPAEREKVAEEGRQHTSAPHGTKHILSIHFKQLDFINTVNRTTKYLSDSKV